MNTDEVLDQVSENNCLRIEYGNNVGYLRRHEDGFWTGKSDPGIRFGGKIMGPVVPQWAEQSIEMADNIEFVDKEEMDKFGD